MAKTNLTADERERTEFREIAADLERRIEDEELPAEPIPPELFEKPTPLVENPNEDEFEEVEATAVQPSEPTATTATAAIAATDAAGGA
eukprot:CAMPEP_0206275370 /NCGR_PEP_ID=MMETSP0047_2-20121206/35711_1 /ASSEMBLY_ACC=CAM_ASM_000192 /TAXON_ID=195065 /ORGANISM="Chroomonas mesostigmatica_cf, Strain CCMP1168" /LENGTH=88 /DNA_ID=CAMNT_0053704765 /DNA_START=1 /DNA_END=264 /DNA_ORIENTATION=-